MKLRLVTWIATTVTVVAVATALGVRIRAAQPPAASASQLIAQAIQAMGGEERLENLRSLTLDSIGHGFALEQSERPEGPWFTTYTQQTEIRDFEHRRLWVQAQRRNWSFPQWSTPSTTVVVPDAQAALAGTRWVPLPPAHLDDTLALNPERLLLTAKAAPDLHVMPDEIQQRIKQHVLAFTLPGRRLRLLLNPWTHLPTMLEVVSNDRFGVWGDVTERRWFSFWTLEKGGLMYPRQTTVEWNGFPYSDTTVQGLTVDGALDESRFVIPDDVRAASVKAGQAAASGPAPGLPGVKLDESKALAITDNIVQLAGGFNVALVRQPDGIVVIEATTSAAYSAQVLTFAAKRFPGVPVKALVTTSDAWPHVGGIREYVARGIPIYPLDLNVSILSRIVAAPHTFAPDALSRRPRTPIFRPVATRTAIGSGDTRIELIPVRGEIGERMMVAWLPGVHALYSSDQIQRDQTGTSFFMPSMLMEVAGALDREHVEGVERVFGMHLTPTPWSDVVNAIAAARTGSGRP